MTEPTPDETQDEADSPTVEKPEVDWKAKAREWEKRAKSNSGAQAELDRIKQEQMTTEQRLTARAEEAERKAQALERDGLKTRIALAKGLSAEDMDLLHGDTEDELAARADRILALKKPGKPQGDVGQGHRPDAETNDMNQVIRGLMSPR